MSFGISINPLLYHDLKRSLERDDPPPSALRVGSLNTAFGVPIHTSPLFPIENRCAPCDGTGEGAESTYCKPCKGAGRTVIDGMMQNGAQTIMITRALPKAFAVSFPAGLVPQPRLCRGLP